MYILILQINNTFPSWWRSSYKIKVLFTQKQKHGTSWNQHDAFQRGWRNESVSSISSTSNKITTDLRQKTKDTFQSCMLLIVGLKKQNKTLIKNFQKEKENQRNVL